MCLKFTNSLTHTVMALYASLCLPTPTCASLCLPVPLYASLCLLMPTFASICLYMLPYASLCLPMPLFVSLYLPLPPYASICLPMAHYGFLWLPMPPYGQTSTIRRFWDLGTQAHPYKTWTLRHIWENPCVFSLSKYIYYHNFSPIRLIIK